MAQRFALSAINFTLFIQNNSASYPRTNPNKQMLDVRNGEQGRELHKQCKVRGRSWLGKEANDFPCE